MRHASLLMLFIATSCAHLPPEKMHIKVSACLMDPANSGLQCGRTEDKMGWFIEFKDADNYVCFSPEDAGELLRRK